ncbi:MAG: universal stress protein [Methermicoccaceae archaeon]
MDEQENQKIRKILIATDGSDYTRRAIQFGLALARDVGAKVYALYVMDIAPLTTIPLDGSIKPFMDTIEEEGKDATNYVVEEAKKNGVEVEPIVIPGRAAEEIVKYADENKIDLIVMGTLGRSGLERILLGSVAERVIRTSNVPVITVRGR